MASEDQTMREAIEARRRAEEALRAAEARLARAEHEATALRDELCRNDELLGTLSHELRNPLTPLKVALDVMKLLPDDPDQLAASREIMERQVAQLSQIVDDLLDLSRLARGKLRLGDELVDAAGVIDDAVEATRAHAQPQRHQITVATPAERLRVRGDRHRLTQVITRLLANAIKHTPEGGAIAVIGERDGARRGVRIRVRDDGAGIAPDLLPHVFDLVLQRHPGGRPGLGIDLHLARRLVELQGGTITARSDGEGRGSELVVELPLAVEP